MNGDNEDKNIDLKVIDAFGHEWAKFNYSAMKSSKELDEQFLLYSKPLDFAQFKPSVSIAADFGAGSGRWTERLLPFFYVHMR